MRLRYTSAILLLPCLAMAQPVIDQSDMPAAGDALSRTQVAPNPFLDYATTGRRRCGTSAIWSPPVGT